MSVVTMSAETVEQPMVRAVTDEEVRTFWDNGWVKLPGLLSKPTAAAMLARSKEVFGEDGCKGLERKDSDQPASYDYTSWFRSHFFADQCGEEVRAVALSAQLGENLARLYGRDCPIRALLNNFQVKLPRKTGVGEGTTFHQDTPGFRYVEGAVISVWVALDEVTADMGGLQFRTGSHRLGDLGTMQGWDKRLEEFPLSPPMELQPGDATAHVEYMFHGTGPNLSERPRWSWATIIAAGDARYTGAQSPYSDHMGLKPMDLFDHPSAPIIYKPGA